MNQRVPNWDLEEINPNHDIYKLDYEVAELTWENGQLALHDLGSRRVPTKSQPTTSWEQPRATETLEALVHQATFQPYCKTEVAANDDEQVPWMHHHNATVSVGNLNEPPTMTSDALVPSTNNRTGEKSAQPSINACCLTRVSCSGNPSAFRDPTVARGSGGVANEVHNCRDMSMSGTFVTCDASAGDPHLTSMGSPEQTSSVRDVSKSTFPHHTAHRRTQRETKAGNEKKTEKAKSSVLNKRRRTAATHNQSERKRRDNINQKLKTLQKLVPNSSKTDKASMLEEVIKNVKQLQIQLHSVNMMNMSPMMMSLVMQQQLQLQKSMMNPMGIGMGMGMGMGMGIGTGIGGMDMNSIGPSDIPARFHPSAFMPMPSWNNQAADQVNIGTMAAGPMSAFLAPRCQPPNMDSYSRMAALYQQMQNQPCGSFPKN